MSIQQMKIVCDGAKANGISLVGDRFIGFRFCDGNDENREAANELLQAFFAGSLLEDDEEEYVSRVEFLDSIKDEAYSSRRWEAS